MQGLNVCEDYIAACNKNIGISLKEAVARRLLTSYVDKKETLTCHYCEYKLSVNLHHFATGPSAIAITALLNQQAIDLNTVGVSHSQIQKLFKDDSIKSKRGHKRILAIGDDAQSKLRQLFLYAAREHASMSEDEEEHGTFANGIHIYLSNRREIYAVRCAIRHAPTKEVFRSGYQQAITSAIEHLSGAQDKDDRTPGADAWCHNDELGQRLCERCQLNVGLSMGTAIENKEVNGLSCGHGEQPGLALVCSKCLHFNPTLALCEECKNLYQRPQKVATGEQGPQGTVWLVYTESGTPLKRKQCFVRASHTIKAMPARTKRCLESESLEGTASRMAPIERKELADSALSNAVEGAAAASSLKVDKRCLEIELLEGAASRMAPIEKEELANLALSNAVEGAAAASSLKVDPAFQYTTKRSFCGSCIIKAAQSNPPNYNQARRIKSNTKDGFDPSVARCFAALVHDPVCESADLKESILHATTSSQLSAPVRDICKQIFKKLQSRNLQKTLALRKAFLSSLTHELQQAQVLIGQPDDQTDGAENASYVRPAPVRVRTYLVPSTGALVISIPSEKGPVVHSFRPDHEYKPERLEDVPSDAQTLLGLEQRYDEKANKAKVSVESNANTVVEKGSASRDPEDAKWQAAEQLTTEPTFEVNEITSSRTEQDGTTSYCVRWEGFSETHDTWEPAANLPGAVLETYFHHKLPQFRRARSQNTSLKKRKRMTSAE